MKIDKRETMWLNGHMCLECNPLDLPGHYHGYRTIDNKKVCVCSKNPKHIQPASMRTWQWFRLFKLRDEKFLGKKNRIV